MKGRPQIFKLSVVCLLVLGGALAINWILFGTASDRDRAWVKSHNLTWQRMQLSSLAIVLDTWFIEDPAALKLEMPGEGMVIGTNLMNMVRRNERDVSAPTNKRAEKDLTDVWGHPVQFWFQRANDTNY